MSTNRSRRIDRDTAEQLLAGAVGGPPAGRDASLTGPDGSTGHTGPLPSGDRPDERIARVLAAAAAPATGGELAGEEAALAAFREARLAPVPAVPAAPAPVRRRSMATAALTRAFSTKAAVVVLGATALGGVAVAGTSGLTGLGGGSSEPQRHPAAPVTSAASAVTETRSASPTAGGKAVAPSTTAPSTTAPSGGPSSAPAAPDPSAPADRPTASQPPAATPGDGRGPSNPTAHAALCKAFSDRAGKGERPRTLVGDPQFGGLVAAAGGPDKVQDYCARLLRAAGEDDHQGGPTPSRPGAASPGNGAGGNGPGANNGQGTNNGQGAGNSGGNGQGTNGQGTNGQGANSSGNGGTGRASKPATAPPPPAASGQPRTDRPDDTSGGPR
ncbi:hypothetical protein ABTX81_04005 [Kitasatospora sp. NPDC097605]|uniref:hypothetical protein n=1 Tax=Kitasatospora sp. NPDC097605 TaxID=3157226 RepID=UPI00331C9CFE